MVTVKMTLRIAEYCLILCSLILNSNGLDCRSEGGPKEKELKKIFNMCMKQQNKNNNDNGWDFDQDSRETRRYNRWPQDDIAKTWGNNNSGFGKEERPQNEGNRRENSRDRAEDRHSMSRQDRRSQSTDNKMQQSDRDGNERMYSRDGDNRMYSNDGDERMYSRGGGEKQNSKGDNRSQRTNGVNDRNDFFQNEHMNEYNNNQYSTPSTRRYKRERRIEVNSGKRSQYNPNSRFSGNDEEYKNEGKNTSESNSTDDDDSKACAVHCLLENLQMTDESGIPDRYLVTHAITNNVKDEDLKDFLQESIEECFQILDNEDSDDKCEFSKNLLVCLSEKGKANCDDWKDDFQL